MNLLAFYLQIDNNVLLYLSIMSYSERSKFGVVEWNLNGALSDLDRAPDAVEKIIDTNGLVVSLPDAYQLDSRESRPSDRKLEVSFDVFRKAGYEVVDTEHREFRPLNNFANYHFLTLLKRGVYQRREIFTAGTRKVVTVDIAMQDTIARVASVYLSDQSEQKRLFQVEAIKHGLRTDMPTALIGDLNAMHGDLIRSRVLRARMVRAVAVGIYLQNATLSRLADMARGGVLKELERLGLEDADPDRQPTMPSRYPLFQLDHVLFNKYLSASRTTVDFQGNLSDHAMISSTITLNSEHDG